MHLKKKHWPVLLIVMGLWQRADADDRRLKSSMGQSHHCPYRYLQHSAPVHSQQVAGMELFLEML